MQAPCVLHQDNKNKTRAFLRFECGSGQPQLRCSICDMTAAPPGRFGGCSRPPFNWWQRLETAKGGQHAAEVAQHPQGGCS